MARVLIVEDERVLAKNLGTKLKVNGHDVTVVHSGEEAMDRFPRLLPDVVLLDIRLPGDDGMQLLPRMRKESPSTNVIMMTAHGNERMAVDAMKAGAFEYLTKPVDLDELLLAVKRAVDHQQMSDNLTFLRSQERQRSGLEQIIGNSATTRALRETIRRLTKTDVLKMSDPPTILITGETGTGKDLAARAIHYEGPRAKQPFIHVNCTALPAPLFESELFGHVPGAFTSASQAKRGLFEVAQGGTIFLDEIGHLEPEVQAKLLHTIEHREIRPVGGTNTKPINVHIIAATNRDLPEAVETGAFRRDLYHRLRVVEIELAPLAQRREDIGPLTEHFLEFHCRRFGIARKQLTPRAVQAFESYGWRGNVRELSHVIESTVLQVDGPQIDVPQLSLKTADAGASQSDLRLRVGDRQEITIDFQKGDIGLEEIEQTILKAAYEYWGRNLSRAARSLRITREALRYRLNKFMTAPDDDGEGEKG